MSRHMVMSAKREGKKWAKTASASQVHVHICDGDKVRIFVTLAVQVVTGVSEISDIWGSTNANCHLLRCLHLQDRRWWGRKKMKYFAGGEKRNVQKSSLEQLDPRWSNECTWCQQWTATSLQERENWIEIWILKAWCDFDSELAEKRKNKKYLWPQYNNRTHVF